MFGARHLVIVGLVPAAVIQDQIFAALDDTDVDRDVYQINIVHRIGATGTKVRSGMNAPNGTFMNRLFSTSHTEQTEAAWRCPPPSPIIPGGQCSRYLDFISPARSSSCYLLGYLDVLFVYRVRLRVLRQTLRRRHIEPVDLVGMIGIGNCIRGELASQRLQLSRPEFCM